jgi:hypothetical protein
MNNKSAYKLILSMLLVAFVFTNCDVQDANVGTFEDAADKIPNFTVIPGAENVSVKVERNNNNAYFNVNLGNISDDAMLLDGDYLGWCAHWSAPIGTRGEVYDGVSLYSTMDDKNWNELNYLLNMRRHFMDTVEGASYKEIQAVIWELIEFKEFDVEENRIFSDLNHHAFNKILENVRLFGSNFRLRPGMIQAVFADMSVNETDGTSTQTVIIERGDTAWGGDTEVQGNPFFNCFDTNGPSEQGIYAGNDRIPIGRVTVSDPVNGKVTITIALDNDGVTGWFLKQQVETVKIKGFNSPPTWEPLGGYPYKTTDLVVENVDEYPYYGIHLDVQKLVFEE